MDETHKHKHVRRTPAYAAPGTLRIAAIAGLPALLEELSVDVDTVLAVAGLSRAEFADPDNLIAYQALGSLLLECERRTGCDHFGLLLGARSRVPEMGLSGRVARCASTVGGALESWASHFNIHDSAAIIALVRTDPVARLVYAIHEPGLRDTRHFQLGGLAIAFNVIQDFCGSAWRPREVRFACAAPSKVQTAYRYFGAPLHFNCDEAAIEFDSAWLDQPLPAVDDTFRAEVAAEARERLERAFEDFPGLVRNVIRKRLMSGNCSIESVAGQLFMHRRTLDRRLARSGVRYGALLASVKYEMATRLLRETRLSVQQVAESLHFASAGNFSTAFRQWSGRTPTEFRASCS
jgi:AraC-like DNA-binding protein